MKPLQHTHTLSVSNVKWSLKRFYEELCRWAEVHRLSHVRYHRKYIVMNLFVTLTGVLAGTADVSNLISQLTLTAGIDATRIALFTTSIVIVFLSTILNQVAQTLAYKARATFHEEKRVKFMELAIAMQRASDGKQPDSVYEEIRERVRETYVALIPDTMQCDDDIVAKVTWESIAARYTLPVFTLPGYPDHPDHPVVRMEESVLAGSPA
jgi:hypothetical protein